MESLRGEVGRRCFSFGGGPRPPVVIGRGRARARPAGLASAGPPVAVAPCSPRPGSAPGRVRCAAWARRHGRRALCSQAGPAFAAGPVCWPPAPAGCGRARGGRWPPGVPPGFGGGAACPSPLGGRALLGRGGLAAGAPPGRGVICPRPGVLLFRRVPCWGPPPPAPPLRGGERPADACFQPCWRYFSIRWAKSSPLAKHGMPLAGQASMVGLDGGGGAVQDPSPCPPPKGRGNVLPGEVSPSFSVSLHDTTAPQGLRPGGGGSPGLAACGRRCASLTGRSGMVVSLKRRTTPC